MICEQLKYLQENFAALLTACDQQASLEFHGMVPVENKQAIKALREELQKRLTAVGKSLAAHVREHGCAN